MFRGLKEERAAKRLAEHLFGAEIGNFGVKVAAPSQTQIQVSATATAEATRDQIEAAIRSKIEGEPMLNGNITAERAAPGFQLNIVPVKGSERAKGIMNFLYKEVLAQKKARSKK